MKKITYLFIALILTTANIKAQDYAALERFMKKYCQNWEQLAPEQTSQIGTTMPEYKFNKELNSKKLKGKYVIMNVWATWCGACIALSADIDTVMFRNKQPYENLQVIGVNAHEQLVNKGLKAEQWWKNKGINYPSVGGREADRICDELQCGHPTALLIDPNNVIRGKWISWSPNTAEYIDLAVWALKTVPEQQIEANITNVNKLMEEHEYMKADYLLELMPESLQNISLKIACMVHFKPYDTCKLFDEMMKYEKEDDFIEQASKAIEAIANSPVKEMAVLKSANNIAAKLLNNTSKLTKDAIEDISNLRIKYGQAWIDSGKYLKETLIKNKN